MLDAMSNVDIHQADQRFRTKTPWLDSHHSFSFGHHYEPGNTNFGLLLVSNDDTVAPGTGFDTHPHRDMEIVTWVLDGVLVHQDSSGHNDLIYPGLAQRMSAGTGILHSEKNDSWHITGDPAHNNPVHFIQMWVMPDEPGTAPEYEQLDISDSIRPNRWSVIASGLPEHADTRAIRIRQSGAGLSVVRLDPAASVALGDAPLMHVYVARGSVVLEDAGVLSTGDAARLTAAGPRRITAGADGAEVLCWQMTGGVRGR